MLKEIEKSIINANLEILDYFENSLKKEDFSYSNQIGFGGDNSLKIDLIFEDIFIKNLKSIGNIFSEECGFIDLKKEFTFIIDPLDGSNNFSSNIPYFGTSVAVKKGEEIIAGFVCNLANKTLVYRVLDEDIKYFCLNSKKYIEKIFLEDSKVAIFERAYDYPEVSKVLKDNKIKFRSLGATALSLANAKDYKFVLFIGDLREFDLAAGMFISKDLFILKDKNSLFLSKYEDVFLHFKEIIKDF